jgi:hypothetical protein
MAITDINISDTLETNAPSIRYSGTEGPKSPQQQQQEMQIAQQIWEALGPEQQSQFQSFQQFFTSGIWKQILQQMQQDEGQGEEQGIAGLGPRNMEQQMPNRMGAEYGGRIGYADGLDWKSKKERGPLYIDPKADVPLTEFEKALREMSIEEREEELKRLERTLRRRGNIGRDLGIPGGEKTGKERQMELLTWGTDEPSEDTGYFDDYSMRHRAAEYLDRPYFDEHYETGEHFNRGGRTGIQTLRGRR